MVTKRILVLANSIKRQRRCVAGCELIDEEAGKFRWGDWIRPVSNHDEGALDFVERRLADGKDPKPLDVIQLSLSNPENNPLQPENWLIQAGQPWIKESSLAPQVIPSLLKEPDDLWLQPGQKSDRANPAFLQHLSNLQSLYLVRPESFQFEIRSTTWEGRAKKQLRGLFKYKQHRYDFTLTDLAHQSEVLPGVSPSSRGLFQTKRPFPNSPLHQSYPAV